MLNAVKRGIVIGVFWALGLVGLQMAMEDAAEMGMLRGVNKLAKSVSEELEEDEEDE